MTQTSKTSGILDLFKKKSSTQNKAVDLLGQVQGVLYNSSTKKKTTSTKDKQRESQKKAWKDAINNKKKSSSNPSKTDDNSSNESSSGSGITTLDDAANESKGGASSGGGSSGGSSGSSGGSSGSSGSSPLLEGEMTFEELIGEICNGIDLVFAVKRSTVVVTDYESIFAEAKYLRSLNRPVAKGEDIQLWQLEEGTYELDVNQYGFYNTVKVYYKNGVVTESYQDLVNVYGEMTVKYYEKHLDKSSAIMKAKAYLAAHVRDFNMSIKANILWDGDIDIGDIVTIENPMTMRDKNRTENEKRDPEYYFVKGKSIEWEGETPITGTLELTYGPESPEQKEVPEAGTSYSNESSEENSSDIRSSTDINVAIDEVGKMAAKKSYSHACQSYSCMKSNGAGDCWAMSNFISCELKARNVTCRILQYPTSSSDRHRSVQYKTASGKWKDFPYRKYGCNMSFNNTSGTAHGKQIKGDCD